MSEVEGTRKEAQSETGRVDSRVQGSGGEGVLPGASQSVNLDCSPSSHIQQATKSY